MSKLIIRMQTLWTHITKIDNCITDKIINRIIKINVYIFIFVTVTFYGLGIVINYFFKFPKFN